MTAFLNNAATISGTGGGSTAFFNSSSAGSGTFTNNGTAFSGAVGGVTLFSDTATASSGTFINNAATITIAGGGQTLFFVSSSAGNGTFINNGGGTGFVDTATAGSGTFINNNGGTFFSDNSTADSAMLIANGESGGVSFFGNSTGGTSRVEVFGSTTLDVFSHNLPGVTIGSIEGDGSVFFKANNLTVGSNNLSTTFSGVIEDFNAHRPDAHHRAAESEKRRRTVGWSITM